VSSRSAVLKQRAEEEEILFLGVVGVEQTPYVWMISARKPLFVDTENFSSVSSTLSITYYRVGKLRQIKDVHINGRLQAIANAVDYLLSRG
jgi:hypothetical protein